MRTDVHHHHTGQDRPVRAKLEREIERPHALVDAGTKQRIVLHADPRAFWEEADSSPQVS